MPINYRDQDINRTPIIGRAVFYCDTHYYFRCYNCKHMANIHVLKMAKIKIYVLAGCEQQNTENISYKACDLYQSHFYGLSKKYMKTLDNSDWLIMSDFHGLVWQGMMLAPYSTSAMTWAERKSRITTNLAQANIEKLMVSMGVLTWPKVEQALEHGKSTLSSITFVLLGDTPSLRLTEELLKKAGAKVRMPMKNLSAVQQSLWILNTAKTEVALECFRQYDE